MTKLTRKWQSAIDVDGRNCLDTRESEICIIYTLMEGTEQKFVLYMY